jgi:hypothetical protein
MATATKKGRSATSKAKQRSKAAAAANGNGPSKRELAHQRDLELAPKILEMRNNGASWSDVKAKLGVDQPKGQVLIKMAAVKPKDRIKADNDKELGKAIVAARKSGLSWADISVRAGITMGRVKALFEASGGGPAGESRVKAEKPAAAKTAAKVKTAAKGKGKPAAKGKTRRRGTVAADPS